MRSPTEVTGALAVEIAKAERSERQHVPVLDGRVEHLPYRRDQPGVADRLDQLVFRTEEVVDRQHARFRRHRRRVGGRADHEIDVAGADLLQHLGLLPQLRAGKLVDRHRPVAQLHKLAIEKVRRDAIARRMRLVVGETEVARLIRPRRHADKNAHRDCDKRRAQPPSAHPALLPLAAAWVTLRQLFGVSVAICATRVHVG